MSYILFFNFSCTVLAIRHTSDLYYKLIMRQIRRAWHLEVLCERNLAETSWKCCIIYIYIYYIYIHKYPSIYLWAYIDDVIKWKHFPLTEPLCGLFTCHWWIPLTKASGAELWRFFLACVGTNGWVNNRDAVALIMTSLYWNAICHGRACFVHGQVSMAERDLKQWRHTLHIKRRFLLKSSSVYQRHLAFVKNEFTHRYLLLFILPRGNSLLKARHGKEYLNCKT